MGIGNLELICFVLCSFCLYESSTLTPRKITPSSPPGETTDFSSLETAIQRLQDHFDEKLNTLGKELNERSRSIEYYNWKTQEAVAECGNNITKFMDTRTRRHNVQPQRGLRDTYLKDTLEDDSQTEAALRLINADLEIIKQNLSKIADVTKEIWETINFQQGIQKVFEMPSDQNVTPPPKTLPKNCNEIKQNRSGVYVVQPENSKTPFMVFCDMASYDGGWLTIHNRYEGTQDFDLDWNNYKHGFGNIAGEYWLGLEKIYQLTGSHLNELLVEVLDSDRLMSTARYGVFSVGSEEEGYPLKVLGGYKGNAGDYLSYSAGSRFSTKDKDQDSWDEGSCAQTHSGGWWYKACDKCNLNAKYLPGAHPSELLFKTMYWNGNAASAVGLLQSRMLIRPREDVQAPSMVARLG